MTKAFSRSNFGLLMTALFVVSGFLVAIPQAFADTAITLTPDNGPVGTTVKVNGSHFHSKDNIVIKFGGATIATTPSPCVASNSGNNDNNASFSCSFNVPSPKTPGSYEVTANDEHNHNVSKNFTVRDKSNQAALIVTGLPPSATYAQTGITAGTSGGSGTGAVTFSAGSSTACSINSSGNVTITSGTGVCAITATKAGDSTYNEITSAPFSITITKADQTIIVNTPAPTTAVYGNTLGVAASVSSGLGVAVTTTGICSGNGTNTATITMNSGTGTCTVHYNQAGNTNYNAATEVTGNTTAQKASSTTIVSGGGIFVYDGNTHTATVSVTGANGLNLTPAPVYSGICSAAPVNFAETPCTVSYTYDGDDNYSGSNDYTTINIIKANPVCTITGYTGTYDGDAHGATGSCIGVKGETLEGLNLGDSFTNYPGGTANWIFTDTTGNYNNANASVGIAINVTNKADPTCTITGYTGTYDGDAHGASGTCIGVKGETLEGLNLGDSFTNYPGGTANWIFTDTTGNYNNANGPVNIVIGKADANCLSITGYTGTYDGDAHGASGTCIGVKGETLEGLNLGDSFTNYPGGTANWIFTDTTGNYNSATAEVIINITKVTPTITWSNPADITYGTALSATQLNATATVDGTFAYTPVTGTVLAAGTHTLSVTFAPEDTTNYNSATDEVTINVNSVETNTVAGSGGGVPYCMISVYPGIGGSISPSSTSFPCGSNQTYTITPDSGYQIDNVLADGNSVGAVTTYTFSNIKGNTISATFSAIPTPTITYKIGDINRDGNVDEYDFAIMMSQWGQTGTNLSADLNLDAVVDEYDFALLMANWGL